MPSEAKLAAADIRAKAEKQAALIVEEAKGKAQEEGARQRAAAEAEIEQETNRAREQLRGQVAALSLAGAEKVLGAAIDREAHNELVEKLASEL